MASPVLDPLALLQQNFQHSLDPRKLPRRPLILYRFCRDSGEHTLFIESGCPIDGRTCAELIVKIADVWTLVQMYQIPYPFQTDKLRLTLDTRAADYLLHRIYDSIRRNARTFFCNSLTREPSIKPILRKYIERDTSCEK
jgi:hypothetical protein